MRHKISWFSPAYVSLFVFSVSRITQIVVDGLIGYFLLCYKQWKLILEVYWIKEVIMIKGIMFWRKCFYLAAIEGLSMLNFTIAIEVSCLPQLLQQ